MENIKKYIIINKNSRKIKDYIDLNINIISKYYAIDLSYIKYTLIKQLIINNINPKCSCGKLLAYNKSKWYKTCGNNKCIKVKTQKTNIIKYGTISFSKTEEYIIKYKKTSIKKFGKENYSQTEEYLLKSKESSLQKYGVENYSQTEEFKEKMKKTSLQKYGVENYSQTEDYLLKSKDTNLKKFGVENYSKTEECQNKIKETCLQKFGKENYSQTEDYLLKCKKTSLQKYGVENYSQTEECQNKMKETCLERYGVESYMKINLKNIHFWDNKKFIEDNFFTKEKYLKLEYFMKFFNCSITASYKKLKELNIDYKKYQGVSEAEYIINDYINSLNLETIQSDRKILNNHELDILIPEKNVAFEYCGLMFHSHGISDYSMFNNPKEDKHKHSKKYEDTKEKGIHLYTIFENEFIELHKREIWFSMISNALGKSSKRIGARKTDLRIVNNKDKDKFLEANHMQGKLVSSINLGLYYKDELVSLMTFAYKDSKNKVYKLERFCNKKHHLIQGSSSKLLKYFENNYECNELISYANKRWSNGDLYKTLGFELYNESEPNYFYFKQNDITKLWSRVSFQKHKLKKKLEVFDDSLSETQNMYNNGYRKIYDCGNYCFRKKYNNK